MKLRQAMSKYQALAREFGADSEVAKYALDTIQSKIGTLGDEYKFKSGKKEGQYNISKIEKSYNEVDSKVKQLEREKEQLTRQFKKDPKNRDLKNSMDNVRIKISDAKAKRRELKGVLNINGRDVEESLITVRQAYVNELKEIRNADDENLSPIEREIANQKGTQKSIIANQEYRQVLARRANVFAEKKANFEQVASDVYDVYLDTNQPQERRDKAFEIYIKQTQTEEWLTEALVFLGEYQSEVNDKIIGRLIGN